ncbi:RING/FYVE/PHD zinc finger superfamily protein [Striga asiatica]|uniref:RING/FYVE/PHD zinc finger superfamily protein n=1 Tax=Striga asiatica TaxID=4170 RepID=A0A5A7QR82_STRAF|nr:RING/FYVE/PHD zinc finger superfamily protein [Striga asiatica]
MRALAILRLLPKRLEQRLNALDLVHPRNAGKRNGTIQRLPRLGIGLLVYSKRLRPVVEPLGAGTPIALKLWLGRTLRIIPLLLPVGKDFETTGLPRIQILLLHCTESASPCTPHPLQRTSPTTPLAQIRQLTQRKQHRRFSTDQAAKLLP